MFISSLIIKREKKEEKKKTKHWLPSLIPNRNWHFTIIYSNKTWTKNLFVWFPNIPV